jgi:hypothetical protein
MKSKIVCMFFYVGDFVSFHNDLPKTNKCSWMMAYP